MAIWLKQSTASQEVPLGYFVDSTDGDTEETGLTIANTDIKLWKTGATTLASKNSGGATHISNGVYYAVLDATDTNTLGPMVIFVHESGALTVRLECLVVTSLVYDLFFGSGAGNLEDVLSDIYSDTAAIETAVANGTLSDITSKLVQADAVIDTIYSDTTAVVAELDLVSGVVDTIYSDTTSIALDTGAIYSDTTHIHSKTILIVSDTSDIRSQQVLQIGAAGLLSDMASGVDAIQTAGGALTSDQDSKLTAVAATTLVGGALEDMVSDTLSTLESWIAGAGILSDIGSGVDAIQAAGGALTSDQDSKLTAIATTTLAGGALEDMVSDTYSRLLIVEAAIDSDTASAETIASDTLSLLTLVRSDTAAIEAAGGALTSDQDSKLTAAEDHASDAHSRLVVVEAALDSDQTSRTAAISNIHSRLVVMEAAMDSDTASAETIMSDTLSRLIVVEAAIDSDQTSRTAAISDVKSHLTLVHSETTDILVDTGTTLDNAVSDVHSRLVVMEAAMDSDTASAETIISDIHSRLVVVEAAIDSDQTSRATALSDILSDTLAIHSQTTVIESNTTLLDTAHAEPTGVPAANETPLDKLAYLYMVMRNKTTVTATKKTIYGDDDAGEWEHDVTDDGTTMTKTEANAI
jgi:hypothetical protein